MKTLKSFEEFIEEGVVKRISPDKQRANHLRLESERKQQVLQKTIKVLGIDDMSANDYIEDCYNILLFLIRATMLERGYTSSGLGAHEAEVAYTRNMGMSASDVQMLDQLRYFRNGILYYGKRMDKEYSEKIIAFTKKLREVMKDAKS